MSFDETFRPTPKFDEIQVYELTGNIQQVRELRPSNFEGPVAEWANERMADYGETIIPRHVYVEPTPQGEHRVAWVYHEGLDLESGTSYCIHHITCDCAQNVEKAQTEEEKQDIIGNCKALEKVLKKRANLVNLTYGMESVLNHIYDQERPAYEQSSATQYFVIRSMVYLLEHDYRHPESWIANVESGWDLINLMAIVMQLRPEDVRWYAEIMQSQELAETDGTVIALSPNIREEIDNSRLAA